jgi:hypothetical protein
MGLSRRERRALRRVDRALGRSAARMHSEFWAFTQINADQAMPGQEQVPGGQSVLRRALDQLLAHAAFVSILMAGGGISQARRTAEELVRHE